MISLFTFQYEIDNNKSLTGKSHLLYNYLENGNNQILSKALNTTLLDFFPRDYFLETGRTKNLTSVSELPSHLYHEGKKYLQPHIEPKHILNENT